MKGSTVLSTQQLSLLLGSTVSGANLRICENGQNVAILRSQSRLKSALAAIGERELGGRVVSLRQSGQFAQNWPLGAQMQIGRPIGESAKVCNSFPNLCSSFASLSSTLFTPLGRLISARLVWPRASLALHSESVTVSNFYTV